MQRIRCMALIIGGVLLMTACGRPEATQTITMAAVPANTASATPPRCAVAPLSAPLPPATPQILAPPDSDPEGLTRQAELIILGTVKDATTTGFLPPGSKMALPEPPGEPPDRRQAYTETPVEVECTLKGTAPGAIVPVRTIGGANGQSRPSHEARLNPNTRVVIFLRRPEPSYYATFGDVSVYEFIGDEAFGAMERNSVSGALMYYMWRLPQAELLQRIASVAGN